MGLQEVLEGSARQVYRYQYFANVGYKVFISDPEFWTAIFHSESDASDYCDYRNAEVQKSPG